VDQKEEKKGEKQRESILQKKKESGLKRGKSTKYEKKKFTVKNEVHSQA
jgi:hypothetical protein